jgi:hypothetical protein
VKTLFNVWPGHHLEDIEDVKSIKIEKLSSVLKMDAIFMYLFRPSFFHSFCTETNWLKVSVTGVKKQGKKKYVKF